MDIRKFLKGKDQASGGSSKSPGNKTTSSRRRQPAPRIIDDDDDEDNDNDNDNFLIDDDEDFQPSSRQASSRKPSSRRLKLGKPPVAEPTPAAETKTETLPRKRGRPSTSTSASKSSTAVPAANAGFGGSSAAVSSGGDGNGESAPPPKKPRWVPRADDPPNRGNKPLPVGTPNCLSGHVFVISGILDSLLREECQDLVRQYGARVVSAVSKKVTHGIIGTEPGESKLAKLRTNKTPMINEDDLFAIINASRSQSKKSVEKEKEGELATGEMGNGQTVKKQPMVTADENDETEEDRIAPVASAKSRSGMRASKGHSNNVKPSPARKHNADTFTSLSLWVDKYKPKSTTDLVGNQKAVKDLTQWLTGWRHNFIRNNGHDKKMKDRTDWDQPAVLLVGAPGIGKTTAAHIVCHESGFEPHELNASDVRNKAGVQQLAETVMVANTMSRYLRIEGGGHGGDRFPNGQVLIMDEVDGMSGGDRGGSQELIRMIKKTRVPIICIANDDTTPNMRSLSNSCFKIRFRRPTVVSVTKRLSEIARREGFHAMGDQVLNKLAEGCNGDVRQMINLLQTWRVTSPALSYVQVKNRLDVEGKTLVQKSIFELSLSFFKPGAEGSLNSLAARTDNYFADADLVPLFVQENYVSAAGAMRSLEALADASECIAEGDVCNALVRKDQRWELMPTCAVLSAIRPGCLLAGGLSSQPQFPAFLGNLSKGNKWYRIVQGLEMKIRAAPSTTSGSTRAFRLDYIPALTTCLASPLIFNGASGIEQVIERLDAYYLEKDPDWEEILEAGVYGKGRSPLENIAPAVKKALTSEYNTTSHARSTVTGARVGIKGADGSIVTSKKEEKEAIGVVDDDEDGADQEQVAEDEDGEENIFKEFGAKKGRAGSSRGRGKTRGKGRGSTANRSSSGGSKSKGSSTATDSRSGSKRGRSGRKGK